MSAPLRNAVTRLARRVKGSGGRRRRVERATEQEVEREDRSRAGRGEAGGTRCRKSRVVKRDEEEKRITNVESNREIS